MIIKKKNEEILTNFADSYLKNGSSDFIQIWNVTFPA